MLLLYGDFSSACLDMAHVNNCLFIDLKPQNIGFDGE